MSELSTLNQARAERIRSSWLERKAENPERFTWARIAAHVGTGERGAQNWSRTGGIDYGHCRKLAEYLNVDFDWLWRGRREDEPNPVGDRDIGDLYEQLRENQRLLKLIVDHLGINQEASA